MGLIKEIYEVVKDFAELVTKVDAIKRALTTELKLNFEFLADVSASRDIDDVRRKKIINMLEITELTDAVKYEIPYLLICNRTVGKDLAEKLKIKRIQDYNLEKLVEGLYLMISYLKKDFDNKNLNLASRLLFISKYNTALLEILSSKN
jgi:hypothetical protein